jgi:23S rRNA (adenine2503-C2)-methyltransferase
MDSIFNTQAVESFRKEHKLQPYRIKQIYQEIFHNANIDFQEMTTLSKQLRDQLSKHFSIVPLTVDTIEECKETSKFLFQTQDGNVVESVLMFHFHKDKASNKEKLNRMTLCISSQVGCNVGCIFCVTGKMGLKKNLDRTEILGQVIYINNYIKRKLGKKEDGTLHRIRNIVFMGMGEPMMNYTNVKKTCNYLTDTNYFGLSQRRVTISTSGVIPAMQQFIQDNLPVSLAFSLHAPNQELREELVPTIGKFFTLDKIMQTLDQYTKSTGNEVMYEYVMIRDKNDTDSLAHQTGKLLKNRNAHLNLIAYNPNPAIELDESTPEQIRKFQKIVMSYGVAVTVRKNMGREKNSACGQLGYQKVLEAMQQSLSNIEQ